jgi:hypothetical protein
MNPAVTVKHWIRGRYVLEQYRTVTRRFGLVLSEAWMWGEPSGWALRCSFGTHRIILRRF